MSVCVAGQKRLKIIKKKTNQAKAHCDLHKSYSFYSFMREKRTVIYEPHMLKTLDY